MVHNPVFLPFLQRRGGGGGADGGGSIFRFMVHNPAFLPFLQRWEGGRELLRLLVCFPGTSPSLKGSSPRETNPFHDKVRKEPKENGKVASPQIMSLCSFITIHMLVYTILGSLSPALTFDFPTAFR